MCCTRPSNGSLALCVIGLTLALIGLLSACGGGGGGGGGGVEEAEFVLDPGFGQGGVVTGQGSGSNTRYEYADLSDSGAMAILGLTQNSVFTFGTLVVERRYDDGSLDTAFGGDGQVEATSSPGYTPKGVALSDQDGSILVVADRGLDGYSLLKYAANGSPFVSFGTNGARHVTTTSAFKVAGMVVDADGKIVVAGSTDGGGYVMRHLTSGAPDPTWNGGAPRTFQILGANTQLAGLVHRTGGGYHLAGTRATSGEPDWIIVGRFNTSGNPVPGFGSGGFLMYTPDGATDVDGLVARPDGACAAYGTTSSYVGCALGVDPAGDVVEPFGFHELAAPSVSEGLRGAHSRSGGMLLFGLGVTGSRDVALWQLQDNGSPDTSFGNAGVSVIPIDAQTNIRQLVGQPDGGLLLLGNRSAGSALDGIVMRLVPTAP